MSETAMEQQKIDLEGVLGQYAAHREVCYRDVARYADEVIPALIAELRELRARVTPESIGDKHKDGNWWLAWEPGWEKWYKVRWRHESWHLGGGLFLGIPTHALPMPPAPEASHGTEN